MDNFGLSVFRFLLKIRYTPLIHTLSLTDQATAVPTPDKDHRGSGELLPSGNHVQPQVGHFYWVLFWIY